ncbi:MAG TPA: RraA family protein [Chromatiales bacterium]|nr:RraA family protein [Chromatiales bacterium]
MKTADLCDRYADELQIADPGLHAFGGRMMFSGRIVTVKVFEDNSLVREALNQDGSGQVLVVDGGGSRRCALLGDRLAALAVEHGWNGIVLDGCLRDAAGIAALPLGLRALATHPLRSIKQGTGERQLPVRFAGIHFQPGQFLYADHDGIVVAQRNLADQDTQGA